MNRWIPISPRWSILLIAVIGMGSAVPLWARTIELTDLDADRIALITSEAPRMSWAGYEAVPGFFINTLVELTPRRAMLIRVLLDKVPPGNRITRAEWILTPIWATQAESKLFVWRVVGEWGPGVCNLYRTVRPKPVEWAVPGARGSGSDRAARPTVVVPLKIAVESAINVTQDVELWYSGAAVNQGWMFTVEDELALRFLPPAYTTRGSWKLRITYEPAN